VTDVLALWNRFGGSGPGRWLFSRLVSFRAPYFASISPRVQRLEPGRCEATLRHRRKVRNHIGTVHAIALCNLAELTAGVGTDVSIPREMRWIPKGMSVRYLAKAVGTMTARATIPAVTVADGPRDLHVTVEVRDRADTLVFDADITMWVTPRKERAQ
jgi:acyl-coenzyme A thioesterase PaaI-like protein